MKTLLIVLCLLPLFACVKQRPVKPEPAPVIALAPVRPEFAKLDALYKEFLTFSDDRLFLRFGFTANFPKADWLQRVQDMERDPLLAERARLLASLAIATRLHGEEGQVTRQMDDRFRRALRAPGAALPSDEQTAAAPSPNPGQPQAQTQAAISDVPAAAQAVPAAPQPQSPPVPAPPAPAAVQTPAPVTATPVRAAHQPQPNALSAKSVTGVDVQEHALRDEPVVVAPVIHSAKAPATAALKKKQVFAGKPAAQAHEGKLEILFSGDAQGAIFPQQGIAGPVGGAASRGPIVERMRAENSLLLLLEAGDAFIPGALQAREINKAYVRAMNRLCYDAMGLGPRDLAIGEVDLRELVSAASFPFICSNLEFQKGVTPWIAPYALLTSGSLNVAVVSVMAPQPDVKITGAHFIPPQLALRKFLPLLAPKSDVIILLTQFDTNETLQLLDRAQQVDIVLGDAASRSHESPWYMPAVPRGLGMAQVNLNVTARGEVSVTRTIPLIVTGAPDPELAHMMDQISK